jgi:uncharacterized peroxidase-related enzyme
MKKVIMEATMGRIQALGDSEVSGQTAELFQSVRTKLGKVPNMMRTMGHSPAVLEGYLNLSGALAGGKLSGASREQIALRTAELNHCDYCLAAHSAIGKMVGLSDVQIRAGRQGTAEGKDAVLLNLTEEIITHRGAISESSLAKARDAGVTDGEILEVVANVSLNILTNYVNRLADTEVDFPATN